MGNKKILTSSILKLWCAGVSATVVAGGGNRMLLFTFEDHSSRKSMAIRRTLIKSIIEVKKQYTADTAYQLVHVLKIIELREETE